MAGVREDRRGETTWPPLLFAALAVLLFCHASARAQALYERPFLVLDPGMHTGQIFSNGVATDLAGDFVVTGSADKTVRLWSASDGKLLRTLHMPAGKEKFGEVNCVAVSPDGGIVAVGGIGWDHPRGSYLYLFDRRSGKMTKRIDLPDWSSGLAFSPDGRHLAVVGSFKGVIVFDRDDNWGKAREDRTYGKWSVSVAFSKSGWLATTSEDGNVRLYDPAFKRIGDTASLSGKFPFKVAFSPNGDMLAVGYQDRPVVDLLDGRSLARRPGPAVRGLKSGGLTEVAWSLDGRTLFASGFSLGVAGGNPIFSWDAAGLGPQRTIAARCAQTDDATTNLAPLSDGRLFVTKAGPCLMMLKPDGSKEWDQPSPNADFRNQGDVLKISPDGEIVDFGYGVAGEYPLRFDLGAGALSELLTPDGRTFERRREAPDLKVEQWLDLLSPTLNGKPIALRPNETSRSYAIDQQGGSFVLGAEWTLRAFEKTGEAQWRTMTPGVAWAVNISRDGRLVVAALGDGTIRWYRMADGRELLALKVLNDRKNWVAWTPEGYYSATPGALGILNWQRNNGADAGAEVIPASDIPSLSRPEVLPLVLRQLGTYRALNFADVSATRSQVKTATGAAEAPGPRLYVLTVGIDNYGDKASGLHLNFAVRDAKEFAGALLNTQAGGLYAEVEPLYLHDEEADTKGIFSALDVFLADKSKGESEQDLVVVLFAGHGALVDGKFYLLPYGVDMGTQSLLTATAIWSDQFKSKIADLAEHGRVLLLVDACHSGAIVGHDFQLRPNADYFRKNIKMDNVSVLTSSSAQEESYEDEKYDRHGAFTKALLDALSREAFGGRSGAISMEGFTQFVRDRVPELTEGKQHPGINVNFNGDIFILGP